MPRYYGTSIILREYRESDLSYLAGWTNDKEVTDRLCDVFLNGQTLKNNRDFLDMMLKGQENGAHFIIALKETEEYIGQIDLTDIDWKNRIAQLGIVIGTKEHRGRGFGSQAIKLLLQHGFYQLNLHKVELQLHDYNIHAYHTYLKCGFVEEGRKRSNFFKNGVYSDTIIMGILNDEFNAAIE